MSAEFWWALHLKLWAWQFSQSCIILGVDSSGTPLDSDCYNQDPNHHEDEVRIQSALSLSEKIKWKNCAMPFISVSRFQFVLLFLLLFVTSYNQDFYAKRKAYKRLLFLLPMKAEEADPKVSAGRKPYFCFHWQILKPTGFLRVMMVTFLPSIKSADSHTDIFHVIPWNRYISWNLFLLHHFLLMLEQAIPLTDNMT